MIMISNSLNTYLILGVFLLIVGIYGLIQHKSFIGMLVSTELILNGAGVNFMAFNRFIAPNAATGQVITLFIMGIAAAEAAIVVSFILIVFRKYQSIVPGDARELQG